MRVLQTVGLLIFAWTSVCFGVGPPDKELARRYFEILEKNPTSETALKRLWELHAGDPEKEALILRLKSFAATEPALWLSMAELCQSSGRTQETVEFVSKVQESALGATELLRLGKLHASLGSPEKALGVWKAAAKLDPRNAGLQTRIAMTLDAAGQSDQAIPHWEVVSKDGNPTEQLAAREALSEIYERKGDMASAAKFSIEALRLTSPGHWKHDPLVERTITLSDQAGTLAALELEWSGAKAGTLPDFLKMAALSAHRRDGTGRESWLDKAHKADPNNPVHLQKLARARLALGKTSEAEKDFVRLMELQPDDESALESLALVMANDGREEDAGKVIESFYRNKPQERRIALLRSMHLTKALESALRKEWETSPHSVDATLALAACLLDQGKTSEAEDLLSKFKASTSKSTDPFAASLRTAEFLVDRQLLTQAENHAKHALTLNPENPEAILLLASILETRGDPESALALLKSKAPTTSDRVPPELDQRLISTMQRMDSSKDRGLRNLSARAFAGELVGHAKSRNSAKHWARAALWASWIGEADKAKFCLREALRLSPEDPEILDRLGAELEKSAEPDEALEVVSRLSKIQPTPSVDIRIARLEIMRGNPDAAVSFLLHKVRESPNHPDLVRELAKAQESAGQNFDALDSWIRAFDLAAAADKLNLLKPILSAFSRLGLKDRGLTFLQRAFKSFPEDRSAIDLVRAGTSFAKENHVLPRWREILEEKRAGDPGDLRWTIALSEIDGNTPVSLSPSNRPTKESLELLLREAESKKDLKAAVAVSERLAELPEATPGEQTRHLLLLEETGASRDGLIAGWEKLVEAHPRTPGVLLAAADFFARKKMPLRELACLRSASRLTPLPPEVLLRIARGSDGNRNQTYEDLCLLLKRIPTDPASTKNPPPFPARLTGRPEIPKPADNDPQGIRLLALREVARLLENSPTKKTRIKEFTAGNPMEAVWANWHAGEKSMSLDLLKELIPADPDKDFDLALVSLAFEAGDFSGLRKWILEDPANRWLASAKGFAVMTSAGWVPDVSQVEEFLVEAPSFARLRITEALAAAGMYRQAVSMGLPDDLPKPLAAEAKTRRAGWQFTVRDPGAALKSLREGLALTHPSGSFENPYFSSLRALWLLENPENRAALQDRILMDIGKADNGRAMTAARLLFAALANNTVEFDEALSLWAQDTMGSQMLQAAIAFDSWHLPDRAREICRKALETDQTLAALQGEKGIHKAIENFLFLSLLLESSPERSVVLAKEWVAQGAGKEELTMAASRATNSGLHRIARILYEQAFFLNPGDPGIWTQLLAIRNIEEARSEQPAAWFLGANPEERSKILEPSVIQLVNALISEEDHAQALRILDLVSKEKISGWRALARGKIAWKQGDSAEAVSLLQSIPKQAAFARDAENLLAEIQNPNTNQPTQSAPERPPSPSGNLRDAIASSDETKIQSLISLILHEDSPAQANLASTIKILMESGRYADALRIFEVMDSKGIADHALALAFAEALWKSGRRAEALEIAEAYEQIARVDPALYVSLAAFFLAVDRPDAAIRQMNSCSDILPVSKKCAALRSSAAEQLISRNRTEEAREQLMLAARHPGEISPPHLVRYFEKSGTFASMSPMDNPFGLKAPDLRAFRREAVCHAISSGHHDRALQWLGSDPLLAGSDDGLALIELITDAPTEDIKAHWKILEKSPRPAARLAAKQALAQGLSKNPK